MRAQGTGGIVARLLPCARSVPTETEDEARQGDGLWWPGRLQPPTGPRGPAASIQRSGTPPGRPGTAVTGGDPRRTKRLQDDGVAGYAGHPQRGRWVGAVRGKERRLVVVVVVERCEDARDHQTTR